ncbi:MAG: type VII toxin-antitoxin system HepT family RNase toxin [Thermoproteota archaeon]
MPAPGVKARIDRFWRAIKRLQKISNVGEEQFVENEDLIDASERNLQVAVEATIDVSEALIAYMRWRTPKSYKEIGTILLENKVIDEALSEQFKEAVNIRNILVHNYVYLTPRELYVNIKGFATSLTKNVINKDDE